MKRKKRTPVEIVDLATLDRTEWTFADEKKTQRRVSTRHCEFTCVARKNDESEDIVTLRLSPGWTQDEMLRAWHRYMKKYRPEKWPDPERLKAGK